MKEKDKNSPTLNEESREFVKSLTGGLISKYRDWWAMFHEFSKNPPDPIDLAFYGIPMVFARHGDRYIADMEERGSIMQMFPNAVEQMFAEQREMPLPEFLQEELLRYSKRFSEQNYMEKRGTILNSKGQPATGPEIISPEPKKGGMIYIFKGDQIALKVLYGIDQPDGKVIPTPKPSEVTLLPVPLLDLENKYWYGRIYLR